MPSSPAGTRGNFPRMRETQREWHDIQDRLGTWEIHKFGSNLTSAGPPRFGLWAVIVQSLDQGAQALLETTPIGEHLHLEDEIDTSIPALIDKRAELGCRSSILPWWSNVILRR